MSPPKGKCAFCCRSYAEAGPLAVGAIGALIFGSCAIAATALIAWLSENRSPAVVDSDRALASPSAGLFQAPSPEGMVSGMESRHPDGTPPVALRLAYLAYLAAAFALYGWHVYMHRHEGLPRIGPSVLIAFGAVVGGSLVAYWLIKPRE